MQRWYVKQSGKAYGPIAPGRLKELARGGKIAPESSVRLGDEGKWVPASKVKGLFPTSAEGTETGAKSRSDHSKSAPKQSAAPDRVKLARPATKSAAPNREPTNPYTPPLPSPSAGVAMKGRAGAPHKLSDAFRTIWLQPRLTIRWLIEERNPREAILLISIVFGLKYLDNILNSADTPIAVGLLLFPIFLPISVLIGIFVLYFFGLLYRVVGRMLGGVGDGPEIRTAFAWSLFFPTIVGLPIDILFIASNTILPPTLFIPLWVFNLPIMGLNIWGLVIQIAGLSAAHQFSIPRAIGTLVLGILIVGLVLMVALMAPLIVTMSWY